MATITIKNLRLRTIIGLYDWERDVKQDIIINIAIEFDASASAASDRLEDTVDYHQMTLRITEEVENSSFHLIERLADRVLKIVLEEPKVQSAKVRIDKPDALRAADSVAIELEGAAHTKS